MFYTNACLHQTQLQCTASLSLLSHSFCLSKSTFTYKKENKTLEV